MKTINFYWMLLVCLSFTACQDTGNTQNAQSDSAAVGSNTDSARARDQQRKPENETYISEVEEDGAAFIDSAAVGGMMEVDMGKLAMAKSVNASVKKFAALMVKDHTKANEELKAIAGKLEVLIPEAYPANVKTHMDAMKKLTGKEFDTHYMDMMVKDHQKTLALFRSASSLRPEIKEFAAKTLPVLEKHDQMAKEIRAGLK